MSKSVYSIVLDDDVINMIDVMASRQSTSRSNLINRILAQHISVPTAETMLSDVYTSIDEFLNGHSSLAVQLLGNSSMINMRSSLQYKYNPSVKYTVEIFEKCDYLGQLKVSMRSQNKQLIEILDNFFYLWATLEISYCGITQDKISLGNGKYMRLFRIYNCNNYNDYGKNIASYINLLDKCLKEYFNCCNISPSSANINVKQIFINNMTNTMSKL